MPKEANRYIAVDPFRIVEEDFHRERSKVSESLFTLSNEYMGVRGYFEEGYTGESLRGAFYNGLFEYRDIPHPTGTEFKGFVHQGHFMPNGPDWLYTRIRSFSGELLDLASSSFFRFKRILNMQNGELSRSFIWHISPEEEYGIVFRRFLSMVDPRYGMQSIEIESVKGPGVLEVILGVDAGTVHSEYGRACFRKENERIILFHDGAEEASDSGQIPLAQIEQISRTRKSGRSVAVRLFITGNMDPEPGGNPDPVEDEDLTALSLRFSLEKGKPLRLEREAAIILPRDNDRTLTRGASFPDFPEKVRLCFLKGLERSGEDWTDFWRDNDITLEGDPENQQGIRFCLFHLRQSYHGRDPMLNVTAKGLSGESYGGWTWWDTETYCLPFYLFSNPESAKSLLLYRYHTLEGALKRSRELDCEGARYPMCTINGEEACGTWQHCDLEIHVSAAVAYGIYHYHRVTGDDAFLFGPGLEMLVEISRYYASRGDWSPRTGDFGFWGVMGPDEFQMMVHNNTYTNFLAQRAMLFTVETLATWEKKSPEGYQVLTERRSLKKGEPPEWERKARSMRINLDRESGIYEQHDGFFDLPHVDAESIPPDKYPLYKHWAYVRIFRNDLLKQPDVLLMQFLYGSSFSRKSKEANFCYYEPRCTHESSLSPAIHSILAYELGMEEKGWNYLGHAFRLDLDDFNRNSCDGLHTTSMASAWMNFVYGIGGLRSDGDTLSLSPILPRQWKGYAFSLRYRGSLLKVDVAREKWTLRLVEGGPLRLLMCGREHELSGRGAAATGKLESREK